MKTSLSGLLALCWAVPALAQFGGGGFGGGGGVCVDPQGVIRTAKRRARDSDKTVKPNLSDEITARSELRQVSLQRIDRQVRMAVQAGKPVPPEMASLAGLLKLEYIVLDREQKDVLLVGPAEGWHQTPDGRDVGDSSRRPVLRFEDLAAALRCVLAGRGQVECSIDPSQAGLAAMRAYQYPAASNRREAEAVSANVAQTLGLQAIWTAGVPPGSRFARAMIDADYSMKRMAIGVEKVIGLTTHLDGLVKLAQNQELSSAALARWWFTPAYDAVLTDSNNTVFRFQGQGVRLLNEAVLVDAQGNRRGTGQTSLQGDLFASSFTSKFPVLERRYPVFADLHNLFDLMMVAGLIQQQQAAHWFAGSALLDPQIYTIPCGKQPRHAEPAVAYRLWRQGGFHMITVAFGGVSMRPAESLVPGKIQIDSQLPSITNALAWSSLSPESAASVAQKAPGDVGAAGNGQVEPGPGGGTRGMPAVQSLGSPATQRWWVDLQRPNRE